jgi:hypothetical protein
LQKIAQGTKHTHIQAMWLDDQLAWRDAASVRMSLKSVATQYHHPERAAFSGWLVILQLQFLYILPK